LAAVLDCDVLMDMHHSHGLLAAASDAIERHQAQVSAGDQSQHHDAIRRADKTTLAAFAQELEARGVRTPAGRDSWAPAQVSRLLAA
jgi:hypothetical protein